MEKTDLQYKYDDDPKKETKEIVEEAGTPPDSEDQISSTLDTAEAKDGKDGIEGIAEKLNVNLPEGMLPMSIKIIALFVLIGGLSLGGSIFTNIFNPNSGEFSLYMLSLLAGIALIGASYGMIKQKRWALWILGVIVVFGVVRNPVFSIVPLLLLIYLYFQRRFFKPSFMDRALSKGFHKLTNLFNSEK